MEDDADQTMLRAGRVDCDVGLVGLITFGRAEPLESLRNAVRATQCKTGR
jgi:hypothetical protein